MLDFPNAPTTGQKFPQPPIAGLPVYTFDGEKWTTIGGSVGSGGGTTAYVGDTPPVGAPANALWWESDSGLLFINYNDGTSTQWVAATPANIPVVRSHLAGLTLSTAGSSASFTVAPGEAADSTNAAMMTLNNALTKTTSAWALGSGAGALDAGVIANNTWYYAFLIQRVDTRAVSILISLSPTAPNLPASYTLFRRIGSMLTNGSGQWTAFTQLGDEFFWSAAVQDVSVTNQSTTAILYTLTVPPLPKVAARLRGNVTSAVAGVSVLVSSPDDTSAANVPNGNKNVTTVVVNSGHGLGELLVRASLGQVRAVASAAAANFSLVTYGFVDRRGRDD